MPHPVTRWSIPGISQIKMIPQESVTPDAIRKYEAGMRPIISGSAVRLPIYGPAVCEVEGKHLKSGVRYTTTLKFRSDLSLASMRAPQSYLVADCEGKTTLIGTREGPAPLVSATMSTGEADGSKCCDYKISYFYAVPEVVDMTMEA